MKINELDQDDHKKKVFKEFSQKPCGVLLLAGMNGTGKSTCARAIYREAQVDISDPTADQKMFFVQTDLFMKWTYLWEHKAELIYFTERLYKVKLLVLDDVGTRMPSEAFKDFLYGIIEKRQREKEVLGTIITTNLNSDQMRTMFGDAIISRIASDFVFRFEGKDRRFKDRDWET